MDSREFAHLLTQTQSFMAASARFKQSTVASDSCDQPSTAPVSPRQKFQHHVRTLSDNSSSDLGNASRGRSPELHHFSSLRVHPLQPHSPRDNSLSARSNEPHFVREEREAWSRHSPSRQNRRLSDDAFLLRPPEAESPIVQPSKQQRQRESPHTANATERPRTSRVSKPAHSSSRTDTGCSKNHLPDGDPDRPSKFAEGSMTAHSGGISSTWADNHSISTVSGDECDEDDTTPRGSPERHSLGVDSPKPAPVSHTTFKQRLAKFGSAFKSSEAAARSDPEQEPEPQAMKKKRGLRKSISMWNLHHTAEKTKPPQESAIDFAAESKTPRKRTKQHAPNDDMQTLNNRKRRAEEAYAQQFGSKRRKSNVGPATAAGNQLLDTTPTVPQTRSKSNPPTNRRRLSMSSSSTLLAESDSSKSHTDLDHQKRPSRRELEKENQQLRALLRQQHEEDTRLTAIAPPPKSPSRPLPVPPNKTPRGITSQPKPSVKTQKPPSKSIPPVPPIPDRVALKPLTNTTNLPRNKTTNNSNAVTATPTTHGDSNSTLARTSGLLSARSDGRSRPVSVIFEEDEEALQENQVPAATPGATPNPSPKRTVVEKDLGKNKVQQQVILHMKGVKREDWEWPEDVF